MAEVRITITAKDGTQQVFKAVEDGAKSAFSSLDNAASTSSSRTKSAFDGIKASWVAVTAAITVAVATVIAVIKNLIDQAALAARVETLGVVLTVVGRNAGYSAAQMQGYADGVKKMGITTQESLSSVTRMTQAHMDLTKASQLARIAQDAAVIGEKNSSQALATMVQGIQSGEVEVLRGIGINVNFEQSYEKLAQKLGKSTEALTEHEKVTARTNVVLEAGKNIAGTYSASMDTVGKQALSLARYSEEARLKLGELFKPAYTALVTLAANALEGLNGTLAEMNRSGSLAKWGEAAATGITFLAQNAIPLALGGLGLMISTVVSLISKFEILQKVSAAAFSSPNLLMLGGTAAAIAGNQLGQWIKSQGPEGQAEAETNDWVKQNREFLSERWKKTQKQLDESGIKGIQNADALFKAKKSGDVIEYKVKIGENVDMETGKMVEIFQTRFKDVRNELQKTKEQIDATTKGFAAMSTVLDQMGGMSLKIGGEDLRRQISQEVLDMRTLSTEYQALSDAVKTGLQMDRQADQTDRITKAFAQYGVTIDNAYSNQITLQKEVLAEMQSYETKQSNIAKQAANVTETEIKYNEAILASYRNRYDELTKMRKAYEDVAAKSAANIVKLDRDMAAGRKQTGDLLYEMWNKANPAANETEEWNRKWTRLQQEAAYTATLPIDKQADAYAKLAQSYSEMGKVIIQTETERRLVASGQGFQTSTEFQDVAITKYVDTWQLAESKVIEMMQNAQAVQQATRDQEAQNQAQALAGVSRITSAMEDLESAIKTTETTLINLDNLLAQQRALSIDVSGALSGLAMVRDYTVELLRLQAQLNSRPAASPLTAPSSSTSYTDVSYEPGPGGGETEILGSLGTGTNYVPRTGLYELHLGEKVTTAEENGRGVFQGSASGGVQVTFGNIIINAANKDTDKIADELVSKVREKMRQIDARK